MNLVWCDQACKYQKDGCCHLKSTYAIISSEQQGCCYFQPIKQKKSNNKNTGSK